MATPTIPNGEEHFFPIIYEGNGAGQRVGNFVPFTDNGTIANSCIFNGPDTAQLTRTPSSGGNQDTFTFSCWAKRGRLGQSGGGGSHQVFLSAGADVNNFTFFGFRDSGSLPSGGVAESLNFVATVGGSVIFELSTSRTFEDTSSYNHYMVVYDSGNSTSGDRIKLYVNGERVTDFNVETYPSQNQDSDVNENGVLHRVGAFNLGGNKGHFDGYLAEVNLIDGTALTPDTFGVTDTSTGRWIPKTLSGITYGTNGFRLQFGSSSALGDDTSGNNNDFSVSNLVAGDQTTDSPTQNHATLQGTGGTLSEGNLKLVTGNSDYSHHNATLKPKSGKYYAEFTCNSMGRSEVGIASTTKLPYSANNVRLPATDDGSLAGIMWYGYNGNYSFDSGFSTTVSGTSYTTNDIIGIALDLDNLNVKFYKNNTLDKTFNIPNSNYTFVMGDGATGYGGGWTANFGQKSFTYTPPTGFVALQQDNLPENSKGITGFSIIKNRDATDGFIWQDSMRGVGQYGGTAPSTAFNTASTDMIQKYLKGGFQTEDADAVNTSGESYVAHNWVLNNGTNVTDTSGDLSTELQANPTAGVSVANFTVSGSGNVTWAHGLGGVPEMGMLFVYNGTPYGTTYHHSVSATPWNNYLFATSSQALATASGIWGSSKPSSTLWTGLVGSLFSAGVPYTFYSFRGIEGFSKVGKYNANNSADGPFAYCGFRPSFLLIKSVGAISWYVIDSKRSPINPVTAGLTWDNNQAEFTNQFTIDFLSNGFKIRNSSSGYGGSTNNTSYSPYVYYAVAENPFVGDGTNPVTAR